MHQTPIHFNNSHILAFGHSIELSPSVSAQCFDLEIILVFNQLFEDSKSIQGLIFGLEKIYPTIAGAIICQHEKKYILPPGVGVCIGPQKIRME